MLSFSKVVTLAAVAFGALTHSAPLDQRDASLNVRVPNPFVPRTVGTTLEGVLVELQAKLEVAIQPLCMDSHPVAYAYR
jgi:hypothetical protein